MVFRSPGRTASFGSPPRLIRTWPSRLFAFDGSASPRGSLPAVASAIQRSPEPFSLFLFDFYFFLISPKPPHSPVSTPSCDRIGGNSAPFAKGLQSACQRIKCDSLFSRTPPFTASEPNHVTLAENVKKKKESPQKDPEPLEVLVGIHFDKQEPIF